MYLILIYYCYLFLPIFTFLSVLVNQDFGYRAILVTLLWAVPLAYAGLVYPYIYAIFCFLPNLHVGGRTERQKESFEL